MRGSLPTTPDRATAALAPRGRISVADLDPSHPIAAAFARGTGPGLLHLGAIEVETPLSPSLAFWRRLGRAFVTAACAAIDPLAPTAPVFPEADSAWLQRFAAEVPPMRGAELVVLERLRALWGEVAEAYADCAGQHAEGARGYLEQAHPNWHVAGRVCVHLAENKRDPDRPFAFIATYARATAERARVQHVPLHRALREYAGAGNRAQLVALLEPLRRAAAHSPVMQQLVDTGDVYHPLSWSADTAAAFLRDVPSLERAGLVVRVPDWWRSRRSRRPSVTATIGEAVPTSFGLGALLSFDLQVSIAGEPLTEEELAQILADTSGLVWLKGQWVEVDADRLEDALERLREVQAQAEAHGLSFVEAMRMLAGADVSVASAEDGTNDAPVWSDVVAGRWLHAQLEALRDPEVSERIAAHAGLDAELRPYQMVGVQWLHTLYGLGLGGCLADDMGLGKTIQVIGLLSLLLHDASSEAGVDLLVVPASLLDNWTRELARFAPRIRVLVAHASSRPPAELKQLEAAEVDAHHVVLTTYGTAIRLPWIADRAWRALVLDEAQAIKNPNAKQTRALKRIPSRWRLALTGTPVENRLSDLRERQSLAPGIVELGDRGLVDWEGQPATGGYVLVAHA